MKKRGCLKRIFQACCALSLVLLLLVWGLILYPGWGIPFNSQRQGNPPLTPAWALECWVWEDDTNTAESTLEMVNGHIKHDFPVRTILIDSPWSTRYNDFAVDESRFPNPEQFFTSLDDRDIRVVLWMTSMVNHRNKDTAIADSTPWHNEAAEKGYLLTSPDNMRWWKGEGGFIDYTNPDAMAWWRGMQEQVLNWGVDGWKLDGSATLAFEMKGFIPWFYADSDAGRLTTRRYMDHYYRDELAHGQSKNAEFVTLSRSLDSVLPWGHPEGVAPIDASPVNWVGDNKHTWSEEERGLQRAIRLILKSADMGYNIVGSDIAGYHGDNPIDAELYIRWTQFSTFCGLFLNGGHGERRMWMRSPEELEIIRTYSWLHHELVPYMYHYVVSAHEGGRRLMKPLPEGPYHYLFGEDLLIAPIVAPGGTHTVHLPEGQWRYWFDDLTVIEGPATLTHSFPLEEYPVYIREGAIIPMQISRDYTGIGEKSWENLLTYNIYPGNDRQFEYVDPETGTPTQISTTFGDALYVAIDGPARPFLIRMHYPKAPVSLRFNETMVEADRWYYDAPSQRLIIRSAAGEPGRYRIE